MTQAEQVASVWKPIFERFKIHFDFAYRTFKWGNEGARKNMDAVYCIIIGFLNAETIPTDEQKTKIEKTAQAILDARTKYPDSSLADLYDELTMPPELRKAHQENDRAVMQAYGFNTKMTESECVAELFKMYERLMAEL